MDWPGGGPGARLPCPGGGRDEPGGSGRARRGGGRDALRRLHEHAPELAAYDWVPLADDWPVYAGLVLQGPRNAAWQLDGRPEGYAIGRAGSRQLLLSRDGELEWFRSPPPSLPPIEIRMGAVDASGQVSGSVMGANGGTVEIYHELPHAPRELVATSPVAADGTFQASGLSSSQDDLYRAVYVEPATGIPFGFLPGVPVGVSG